MQLVKWENNRIVVDPMAMAIKAFRDLYNADTTEDKSQWLLMFGTLYFLYDPRSEYQFETDFEERFKMVKTDTGLPDNWRPDALFQAAVPVYKRHTITTSAKTLEKNRKTLDKVDAYLDTVTITDDNVTKIIKALDDKNDLAIKIAKTEKEIYKDVEEHSNKIRGKADPTIGDDGLASLFANMP